MSARSLFRGFLAASAACAVAVQVAAAAPPVQAGGIVVAIVSGVTAVALGVSSIFVADDRGWGCLECERLKRQNAELSEALASLPRIGGGR